MQRGHAMTFFNRFNGSSSKKKMKNNTNEKMVRIIDKLIQYNPEEYEILDDVKIDLLEEIPLSSLKKEQLKKAIKKFKETKIPITKKEDKEENDDFVNMCKIEGCKTFVYAVKNVVETLVNESEKLKKEVDSSDSELLIITKNKLQTGCKGVFSEILQVQNELEIQTNILKNIHTKLAIMDKKIKRSES